MPNLNLHPDSKIVYGYCGNGKDFCGPGKWYVHVRQGSIIRSQNPLIKFKILISFVATRDNPILILEGFQSMASAVPILLETKSAQELNLGSAVRPLDVVEVQVIIA